MAPYRIFASQYVRSFIYVWGLQSCQLARCCKLLWPLLTSSRLTRNQKTSPGKDIFFPSIPIVSTHTFLLSQGFALVWTLTQNVEPRYTIRVPWYRLLPVDFLHCMPHDKPACLVLIGSIYFNNLPIKDFNLPEYFVSSIQLNAHTGHTQQLVISASPFVRKLQCVTTA